MAKLNPTAALDELLAFEKRYRNLAALIPQLQEVASLENYLSELQANVSIAKKDYDELEAVKANVAAVISDERAKAAGIAERAKAHAEGVSAKAALEAAATAKEAKDAAELIVETAKKKAADIELSIGTQANQLAALNDEIAKKSSDLVKIKADIEKIKAKF